MITRGYYIGQIIDELSGITERIKNRAKLGLTDIHAHLEDFYKEILNITLDLNLSNLNKDRVNSPGLDLGDKHNRVAFQITCSKTSKKVNKTLEKSSSESKKYDEIYVLILQDKQFSYTIDKELAKPFKFKKKNIWDIKDVLNEVMYLDIVKLQKLYELIRKELARVTIELEIPDKNGSFETDLKSYIESIPKARFKGVQSFYNYMATTYSEYRYSKEELQSDFKILIRELKRLPRITRQFYTFLLSRCDWPDGYPTMKLDYLERVCNFINKEGELRLLYDHNMCFRDDEPEDVNGCLNYNIRLPNECENDMLLVEIDEFIKHKQANLENVFTNLDFSCFE